VQRVWRIKDLLEWTTRYFLDKGITESRLEAEILLAHVVKKDRVYLYANFEEPINTEEREIYKEYIKRRAAGEPIAYITGHKEFMSLEFKVNPAVLIPRADTEVLVETALAIARAENIKRLIDVGTGSGAIAVSLAAYMEDALVYATDISSEALEIAQENAVHNRVNIDFRQGDLLQAFIACAANTDSQDEAIDQSDLTEAVFLGRVDMITANLPYIPIGWRDEIDRQVRDFEPHGALFAAGDGLDLYRQLIPQVYALLRPEGFLLIEIDPRQVPYIADIMTGFTDIKIIKDWAGHDRVVQARKENHGD